MDQGTFYDLRLAVLILKVTQDLTVLTLKTCKSWGGLTWIEESTMALLVLPVFGRGPELVGLDLVNL